MAEINRKKNQHAALALGVLGAVVLLACVYLAWSKPPQMGPDEDVFKNVDALYTAVTARDERLLEQCSRRLRGLSDTGKLPSEASSYLDGIIAKARAGRWQPAAETLYTFMMAQRRDGAGGPPHEKKSTVQRVAHRK